MTSFLFKSGSSAMPAIVDALLRGIKKKTPKKQI